MLFISDVVSSREAARSLILEHLANGKGLTRLADLIASQGGDPSVVQQTDLLPQPNSIIEVTSSAEGYVSAINALEIGMASKALGAGRQTKDGTIDYSVGIYLKKKTGDYVAAGEPLALLHSDGDESRIETARKQVQGAFALTSERVEPAKLIYARVSKEGIEEY
jgi:pyrimidine-nucleoside phosphorylase